MNKTIRYIAPATPEQNLTELAKAAGESIEKSTQALVGITTALLEQLKAVQSVTVSAVEESNVAPLYMSVTQALERYGICRTTFYQIVQLDGCPKLGKVGKKTIVPIVAFDEFFNSLIMEDKSENILQE